MNSSMQNAIRVAMRLMQAGNLNAATAAIQEGLGGATTLTPREAGQAAQRADQSLEGEFRVLDECDLDTIADASSVEARLRDDVPADVEQFRQRSFSCGAGTRDYKLFIPSAYRGQPMPLVVMLHGCTQTPDDFARGTRMNELAEERGCFVVYPAQSQAHNCSKCWNWFKSADQHRDAGEPAIIAGITREILNEYSLDASRVYIAGLSAGAAMAVVMGRVYPDLFAAVGVHSGLPYGIARDPPSAFAAMRRSSAGATGPTQASAPAYPHCVMIPTIVFHGDRDTTVCLSNGERVTAESVSSFTSKDARPEVAQPTNIEVERSTAPGGRAFTRTIFKDAGDVVLAEQWVVHGSGHAWSGGDARASYTDPHGPDASAEMMRFFLDHVLRSVN